MTRVSACLPAIGRLLLSSLFLWSGYLTLRNPGGTAQYVASVGVPAPGLMAWVIALIELAGGLALLLGIKARWAAAVLVAWCLVTALAVHLVAGLTSSDPASAFDNMVHVYKNLVMAGGLLYVARFGAGALSFDNGFRLDRDAGGVRS